MGNEYTEYTDLVKRVSRNLKAARNKLNMSQLQLSMASDIDQTSISCYEKGHNLPSVYNLLKLCTVLGCSESDIMHTDVDI